MSSKILSVQNRKSSRPKPNNGLGSTRRKSDDMNDASDLADIYSSVFRGLPNKHLIVVVTALCGFGLMAVFSASAPMALHQYHDATQYLRKQTIACLLGFVVMFVVSKYDYRKLKKFGWPLSIVAIIMLALTMVPGLSTTSHGSSRWLNFGPFQFQPSELAKISSILLLSAGLSRHFWWHRQVLFRIAITIAMAAIVVKQPDLGSAMSILSGLIALLYISGTNSMLMFGALGGGALLIWHKIQNTPYQMKRIMSWIDPYQFPQQDGWNIIQAQLAIGSGGWTGLGFGQSLQKLHYLPVQHADFIFAVVAEELGLLGCLILIGLFVAFGYYGFKIASEATSLFGRLLAIGITSSLCVQAVINIMVATAIIPVTGITLPFISYGGSSIVITLAMVGILLSISRDYDPNKKEPTPAQAAEFSNR